MMEAASSTMDRLSTGQLLDIWDDMIGDWTTLSQSKRESYLQMLWDAVVEGKNVEGKSVAGYLSGEEKTELRSVWNVLLDVLLRFVEVDYNTELYNLNNSKTPINSVKTPVAEEYADSLNVYSSANTQAVLGTLAYNASALMQAHYPEINFAWLRSYDSNYTGEANKSYQITTQKVPTVKAEQKEDTITFSVDKEETPGASIFYKVEGGVWRPYNKPLDLNGQKRKISYTAVYCGATSAVGSDTFTPQKTYSTYTVTVDDQLYGNYKEGEVVTVQANTPEGKHFVTWAGDITQDMLITGSKSSDSDSQRLTQALKNPSISFKMPTKNLNLTTQTVDSVSEITLSVNADTGVVSQIKLDDTDVEDPSKLVFNYSVDSGTAAVQTQSMPAAENNAEETATVTATALLNPNAAQNIYFSNSTKATINGQACDVSYNPHDGSVTLTAQTEKTVQQADYCTVTVQCVDLNLKQQSETDSTTNPVVETLTYRVKKNAKLTMTAPSVDDEKFVAWVGNNNSEIEMKIEERTVSFTPTGDMTIQVNYIPVVKKIDITMPEPSVGEELPSKITNLKVTVTNEYTFGEDSVLVLWINWLDNEFGVNGRVQAGDWYAAALYPLLSQNQYTLADDVQIAVNGTPLSKDFLLWDGTSDPVIFFVYEAGTGLVTLSNELLSVQQPKPITRANGVASLDLPSTVGISVGDGSVTSASVRWDSKSYSYDKNSTEQQSFVVTGKVQYKNNPNKVDKTVRQMVVVKAADQAAQVAAPTANIAAGTYTEAQEIRLDCDTDGATIYYTLDGSEPTTANGTKYDGGIVTVSGYGTTKLRMIAVEAGMRDSMEASYQYTIERHSSGGSGKPTQPTEPTTPDQPASGFQDVKADAYYADAVAWAVKQGITNGISETQFGPDQGCTRAQIVTFLWRSAGSPEPKTLTSFADVPADAYYAKAVAWAVEQGITKGTSETAFSPDATCTRAQSVTFLHRADGSPAATEESKFSDVAQDSYYADAVDWAAANGVTSGTSETTFSPALTCTRGQIVTFLYRMEQGK